MVCAWRQRRRLQERWREAKHTLAVQASARQSQHGSNWPSRPKLCNASVATALATVKIANWHEPAVLCRERPVELGSLRPALPAGSGSEARTCLA